MTINRRQFLRAAGAGAGLSVAGGAGLSMLSKEGLAFHDRRLQGYTTMNPTYGEVENLRILGYCGMGFGDSPLAASSIR